jgi:hypothetical protein
MVDLHQTVSDHMGKLESLIAKVPGYKGYKEKEMRREADTLLRQHLANQLAEQLTKAEDIGSQMLMGPGLTQLDDMGKGNTRLQTLIDKVRTAAQGYAGFFDAVRVKEDELDILYEFDSDMLDRVGEISDALENLQSALDSGESDKLAPSVRRYVKTVTDISMAFDRRRDTMIGVV